MTILVAAALLLACAGDGQQTGQTDQAPPADTAGANVASVQVPTFDAAAAHALLVRQVQLGPRVPGTAPHRQQLAWMLQYLRERADTVFAQPFTHSDSGRPVPMSNVVARFNPNIERRLLLLAHWDTRPTADQESDPALRDRPIDGANDGASGVAVLLQLAEVFSKTAPPIGVDLRFTDGEDYASGEMYLGASHFAARMTGYRPMYAILIDMVADQSPVFPIEGNSRDLAPEVVQRVWSLAQEIGLGNFFPNTAQGYITDDHIPLNNAGIRTIDIIDFDYGPANRYWHTGQDVVAITSPAGRGAVGRLLRERAYGGG
ncbi:MAG: M28 family peptidase [Gemmatimonadetes bacterium]|nr:M28 family peptidase [Gemmatimonadota bacterium]